MTEYREDVEREVAHVLQRDGIIPAIKRWRAITGDGLREAREAVRALEVGTTSGPDLPEADRRRALFLLEQGEKIKAVLIARQALGLGLREAKDLIDRMEAEQRASAAADAMEARIRADERARIATTIEAHISDTEFGASQSVYNGALRLAARIARGE